MKKLTAILTAAVIALSVTASSVFALPDESNTQNSVSQETSKENSNKNSEETSKENSNKNSEEISTETAEKITYKEYSIPEIEMKISFPDNMYVLTKDIENNSPVLDACKITKEELVKSFEASGIYVRASQKDFSYDITVTVIQNSDTDVIGNLTNLTDNEVQQVIDNLLKQDTYIGCAKSKFNNILFLSFELKYDISNTQIYGLQEYTIINGKQYVITLQSYNGEITDKESDIMKTVMKSIEFDGVNQNVQTSTANVGEVRITDIDLSKIDFHYICLAILGIIAVVIIIIMITVSVKYNSNKKKKQNTKQDEKKEPSENIKLYKKDVKNKSDIEKAEPSKNKYYDLFDISSPNSNVIYEESKKEEPVDKVKAKSEKLLEDKSNYFVPYLEQPSNIKQSNEDKLKKIENDENKVEIKNAEITIEFPAIKNSKIAQRTENIIQFTPFENNKNDTAEDIVFAENILKSHTTIKQISENDKKSETVIIDNNIESKNVISKETKSEDNYEQSEFEKRFGKHKFGSELSETKTKTEIKAPLKDTESVSKFEERFGKITLEQNKTTEKPSESKIENKTEEKSTELKIENKTEEKSTELKIENKTEEKSTESKIENKTEEKPSELKVEDKAEEKPSELKIENKTEEKPSELKVEDKAEEKPSELKVADKTEEKPSELKVEDKAEEKPSELKVADKTEEKPSELKVENKAEEKPSELKVEDKAEEKPSELKIENKTEEKPSELKVEDKTEEKPSELKIENKTEEKPSELKIENKTEEKPSELKIENKTEEKPSELKVADKTEEKSTGFKVEDKVEEKSTGLKVENKSEEKPSELKVEDKAEEKPSELKVADKTEEKSTGLKVEDKAEEKSSELKVEDKTKENNTAEKITIEEQIEDKIAVPQSESVVEKTEEELSMSSLNNADENKKGFFNKLKSKIFSIDEDSYEEPVEDDKSIQEASELSYEGIEENAEESKQFFENVEEETDLSEQVYENVDENNMEVSAFEQRFGANRKKNNDINTESQETQENSISKFEQKFGKKAPVQLNKNDISVSNVPSVTLPVPQIPQFDTQSSDNILDNKDNYNTQDIVDTTDTETNFFDGVTTVTQDNPENTSEYIIPKYEETETFEMPKENTVDDSTVIETSTKPQFDFERDTGIIFEHAVPSEKPFKLRNTMADIPRLESVNAEIYNKQMEEIRKKTTRSSANYSSNFGRTQSVSAPKPKQDIQNDLVTENKTAIQQNIYDNKKNNTVKSTKNKKLDKNDIIEYYTGYENVDSSQSLEQETHKKQQDSKGKRFIKSIGKLFTTEEDDDDEIL